MPLAEYHDWYEYSRIEPWGSQYEGLRSDFRAGQICSTVANWAGKQLAEGNEPRTAADFMPSLAEGRQPAKKQESAVLLDDPKAQAKLIKAVLFGIDK